MGRGGGEMVGRDGWDPGDHVAKRPQRGGECGRGQGGRGGSTSMLFKRTCTSSYNDIAL